MGFPCVTKDGNCVIIVICIVYIDDHEGIVLSADPDCSDVIGLNGYLSDGNFMLTSKMDLGGGGHHIPSTWGIPCSISSLPWFCPGGQSTVLEVPECPIHWGLPLLSFPVV